MDEARNYLRKGKSPGARASGHRVDSAAVIAITFNV